MLLRLLGVLLLRLAERKFVPSLFQEPPRLTRFEPDALVLRAYGRPADMADHMAIFDILEAMDADADADATVCLALLASLEFVAQ